MTTFNEFLSNCLSDCINGDGCATSPDLAAICDEPTQPGIVEAYRPPHNPSNDHEITRVDVPAVK